MFLSCLFLIVIVDAIIQKGFSTVLVHFVCFALLCSCSSCEILSSVGSLNAHAKHELLVLCVDPSTLSLSLLASSSSSSSSTRATS